MNRKNGEVVCPRCGYTEGTQNRSPALRVGTLLDGHYLVGAVVNMTGEGMSYIAMDRANSRKVVVREYLPSTLCGRAADSDRVTVRENCQHIYEDYLSDFLDISRAVSRLSDVQSIAHVLDIFEANNTAYAVYEYVAGRTLGELVERANRLTWEEARPLFLPLISALVEAHSIGLVHFAVNPDNVIMTRDSRLVLTGFAVPDSRIAETELRPELCDGFSALEQYSINGNKGKWTDVYSVCALMLFALTGKCPPPATARAQNPRLNVSSALAETIPTHVLTAIAGGLQVRADQRTPSMEELRSGLAGNSSKAGADSNMQQGGSPISAGLSSVAGAVGSFTANLKKKNAEKKKAESGSYDDNEPWYRRLNQFQYALLSTCISLVVLGIIALIIFINIKPLLNPDDNTGPNVHYVGYASGTDVGANAGVMYTVPDLRGEDFISAASNPDLLMFQILQKDEAYSDDYDVGQIISQSISPNTEAPYGTPIAVTVSLGSKMCAIPNIINMTVAQADTALSEVGLCLGSQTEQYNDSVAAGCIVSISGAEIGSRLTRGSAVNIVVSLGPEGGSAQ